MFDLVMGKAHRLPRRTTLPIAISTAAQGVAAVAAIILPSFFVVERAPRIPTVLAFVVPALPPPAPAGPAPAPPAAPHASRVQPIAAARLEPSRREIVPSAAPTTSQSEPPFPPPFDSVPGGVEGGIPGGIAGGLAGGIPEPPPPPPPPPVERAPVRVGGRIDPPALLHRVEPVYPPIAVSARLQGTVILEALVDRDGTVAEVKVLRSAGSVLDREALIAVRQWRYSPLVKNGQRERFVLTVILSFSVESAT